ncbi:hypothetical protein [Jiella pelagia]|uniref:ABC transporter permease n=1 Tax=Jiella pelagia TaxID=2986949 RepID=A0ABY7C2A6_9HYPH|nr:hypothetical protein [Jiella pelagia]WAP68893.1 hypothetical protein OH818_27385 [Jiella pelagia]
MVQGRLDDYQVLRSGSRAGAALLPAVLLAICVIVSPYGDPLPDDRWAALAVDPGHPDGLESGQGRPDVLPAPAPAPAPASGEERRVWKANHGDGAAGRMLAAGSGLFGTMPTTALAGISLRLSGRVTAETFGRLGVALVGSAVVSPDPAEGA